MPFTIIRDDITHVRADALVNTANPLPRIGEGVDAALHRAAGPELLQARQAIGALAPGESALTPAFRLHARWVIHTCGPLWQDGRHGEAGLLRRCYASALALAAEKGCRSVAFPLLATGNYGFPRDLALQIALEAFSAFLTRHDMDITLVVFNREAFVLSEKLVSPVQSYIDEHYVDTHSHAGASRYRELLLRREAECPVFEAAPCPQAAPCDAVGAPLPLEEQLAQLDAGFAETLLALIDRTGQKDSVIYKKANVDRKLFSKIRSNPSYRPSKPTAVAFCLALELSLEATRDLLGRAGYALTHSSKFDVIVEFFIVNGNYDLYQLNETLFHYDQPLVGGA